jgi:ribosome-associated toxin RatA of RatAB toxin-antitoxin module
MAEAKVTKEKEMSVGQDSLFEAITDFKCYPEFVSEVVSVTVESETKTSPRVIFELELVKRFEYTLDFQIKGREEVSWKLLKSNFFKVNQGRWALKSLGGGKTQVLYEVEVAFGFLVPSWITRKLTETNLPKMLDNFETRAKTLEGRAK